MTRRPFASALMCALANDRNAWCLLAHGKQQQALALGHWSAAPWRRLLILRILNWRHLVGGQHLALQGEQ